MRKIPRSQLPAPEAVLRDALAKYVAELEAHKLTIGEPAPWPEFELLRELAQECEDFEVVVDDNGTAADVPLTPPRSSDTARAELLAHLATTPPGTLPGLREYVAQLAAQLALVMRPTEAAAPAPIATPTQE